VDQLRQQRPCYLKALPEYLQTLAEHLEQTGERPPKIDVVKPMGALMTSTMKQKVERAFGTAIREDYGCNELGPMAFDCRFRNGLHLLQDQYYFEFVRNGRPAADGELAVVLITDLHNRAMPLIRYRIGDLARVDRRPCPCGRTTPRITLEGRIQDTIVTSAGRVLTPRMVYEFFYSRPQISQFQLTERTAHRFDLSYVSRHDAAVDEPLLAEGFRQFSGDDRRMTIRRVASLLPESSGKFRHVKSCSYEQLDAALACDSTTGDSLRLASPADSN
ncbi:MAG: phenylacetate--CoA ligase family protein, partial [Planctomycetales bacterium]|nr:phenylacetate--CoA ligase family protein [Planctomycetales bacterium]